SRRVLGAAALSAVSSLLGVSARAAMPRVEFDLRVDGTNAKDFTASRPNDLVVLDLYVKAYGLDLDPTNDNTTAGSGYFRSSSGGLRGNLKGLTPPSPYNQSGSDIGAQYDVDSDGDLDIGLPSNDPFAYQGFYAFRM